MRGVILFAIVFVVGSCASRQVTSDISSGRPEATIDAPVGRVKQAFTETALGSGYSLVRDREYEVVYEKRIENDLAAKRMRGSQYDTAPRERMAVSFAVRPDGRTHVAVDLSMITCVIIDLNITTYAGSALERTRSLNNTDTATSWQNTLNAIKRVLEQEQTAAREDKQEANQS